MLSIGTLLPADEPEGARARLWNLGYRDNRDNRLWHDTDALASFQWNELEAEPGPLDASTAKALVERAGS